jgi:hypothetical protein
LKSIITFIAVIFLLLTGISACSLSSPKILGWSQESFRDQRFKNEDLYNQKLAIFPVLVLETLIEKPEKTVDFYSGERPYTPDTRKLEVTGEQKQQKNRESYRIVLNEMLLRKFQEHYETIRLMTPETILKKINDNNLTESYEKYIQSFHVIGIDENLLKSLGKALDCRYLLISQAVVSEYKSENYYTVVWTFGGKSTLSTVKISSQIWDMESGAQVWEGSGVGYTKLSLYQGPPLIEDLAKQAVESLLGTIAPPKASK